nr:rhodanese-like domain-containing protein [Rhodoferax sp.]
MKNVFIKRFAVCLAGCGTLAILGFSQCAIADVSVLLSFEPTDKQTNSSISRQAVESSIASVLKQKISVTKSEDLAETMRSTRSGSYDVFVASAQVAASALGYGYELLGVSAKPEKYVLVGRKSIGSIGSLKGNRLYLPQQDSIYTYMARGMLNANGLSLKDMKTVTYERYPNAGLIAVSIGLSDSTVVRLLDWEPWIKTNQGAATLLATSSPVPGGYSVVVKKTVTPEVRARLEKWFTTTCEVVGMKPLLVEPELADYKAVAQLGVFTPTALPGAKVVTYAEVQKLVEQGATLVDTRTEKEFKAKHIPLAVFVPYHEKSLKDVVFDAALDDFSSLERLDKTKPIIFSCNGAECWKSYKASKFALTKSFGDVYWFRGGLPEWEAAGLHVTKDL